MLFDHSDGDLDIELHDSDGNYIDGSSSADDNEYISLAVWELVPTLYMVILRRRFPTTQSGSLKRK